MSVSYDFNKVTISGTDNLNCDIQDADYILYQRGYNDTVINTDWNSVDQYDPTLVQYE